MSKEAIRMALKALERVMSHGQAIQEAKKVLQEALVEQQKAKYCSDCGEMNPADIHTCSPQAQRTWVGLTDEEIDLLEELYAPPLHPDFVNDADHCFSLIKKVETKLREKNT